MAERPAVDASPLILLARVGELALLRTCGSRVVVPEAVALEVARKPDGISELIASQPWLEVVQAPSPSPSLAGAGLGAGETAVLAWGEAHPGTIVILDDAAARAHAERLGIPVRGTVRIVLEAKRQGVIPSARGVFSKLRAANMYLSDRVVQEALKLVGE